MPPSERPIPRYIAEPPQEPLPYGRWEEALVERFVAACRAIETDEELGEPSQVVWFPDRSIGGRTYVPASASTSTGFEVFGFVSYAREHSGAEATDFDARADYTDETVEANPEWTLDLRDEEIGPWRGQEGRTGEVALVWGDALVNGGVVATAELGPTTTDQCKLVDDRFTLVSLDNYTGDLVAVKLWGPRGDELASESLYDGE